MVKQEKPVAPTTVGLLVVSELLILRSWRRLCVGVPGLPPHLLAFGLLSQLALKAFFFSGFHVEGVFLDLLDDTFLLNLSLEAPKGALNGLTFVHPNFRQSMPPQYLLSTREYAGRIHHKATVFFWDSASDAVNPTTICGLKRWC